MLYVIFYLCYLCVEKGVREYRVRRDRRRTRRRGYEPTVRRPAYEPNKRTCQAKKSEQKVVEQPDGAVTVAVPCTSADSVSASSDDPPIERPSKVLMLVRHLCRLRMSAIEAVGAVLVEVYPLLIDPALPRYQGQVARQCVQEDLMPFSIGLALLMLVQNDGWTVHA